MRQPNTRQRNPRVVVREELADLRRTAGQVRDLFDLPYRVEEGTGRKRKPTDEELPENQVDYWQALARQASVWERQAAALRDMARREALRVQVAQAPYVTRRCPSTAWQPLRDVHALRDALQAAGFRYSELSGHIADLDAGHLLTGDGHTEFRRGGA